MKNTWSKRLFKAAGWTVDGIVPEESKFVCAIAPHTSFWDFIWGWLAFRNLGISAHFLIKKEFFVFPVKGLLKRVGGISVDRENGKNVVGFCSQLFQTPDSFVLAITPEGTRKRTEKWKKGYYYIAMRAGVPIYIGTLDYQKKLARIVARIEPSGNYDADFQQMQTYWKGVSAKFPDHYNLS